MGNQAGAPNPQDERTRRIQRLETSIGLALVTIVRVSNRLQELEKSDQGTVREQWKLFGPFGDLPTFPGSSERNQSLVEFCQTTLAKIDSYLKQDAAELGCLCGKER